MYWGYPPSGLFGDSPLSARVLFGAPCVWGQEECVPPGSLFFPLSGGATLKTLFPCGKGVCHRALCEKGGSPEGFFPPKFEDELFATLSLLWGHHKGGAHHRVYKRRGNNTISDNIFVCASAGCIETFSKKGAPHSFWGCTVDERGGDYCFCSPTKSSSQGPHLGAAQTHTSPNVCVVEPPPRGRILCPRGYNIESAHVA